MIAQYNKRARGQSESVMLFLVDGHGEYPIDAVVKAEDMPTDGRGRGLGFLRVQQIWSTFWVGELLGEEDPDKGLMKRILAKMPKELEEYSFGKDPGGVWEVYGSVRGLAWAFGVYLDWVTGGETGGDCDTFDYWPSAMRICKQWAEDLDKVVGKGGKGMYMKRYLKAYRGMVRRNGDEVPEFDVRNP